MDTIVGTITVKKDYIQHRTGETACNWTDHLIHAGTYPVSVVWSSGKRVLVASMDASLIESYYVNRVFTASSVNQEKHEKGEKPTSIQWRWGDYNETTAPPTNIMADIKLELTDGWIVTADYRGNYSDGGPIIFYAIDRSAA